MKERRYDRTPRNAASRAVLDLRTTLGQSQQAFATDIKTALTTVSRWEGRLPPHGETLLRLRDVAEKAARGRNVPKPEVERLIQIRDVFHELYWRELLSDKDAQLITFLPTETKPLRGYLLVKVEGEIEIDAARKVLVLGVANAVKNTPEVSQRPPAGDLQISVGVTEEKPVERHIAVMTQTQTVPVDPRPIVVHVEQERPPKGKTVDLILPSHMRRRKPRTQSEKDKP